MWANSAEESLNKQRIEKTLDLKWRLACVPGNIAVTLPGCPRQKLHWDVEGTVNAVVGDDGQEVLAVGGAGMADIVQFVGVMDCASEESLLCHVVVTLKETGFLLHLLLHRQMSDLETLRQDTGL